MAKFDYKKTLEKGAWGLAYVIVAGLIVILTDHPVYGAVAVPVLMMLQNYIKHK